MKRCSICRETKEKKFFAFNNKDSGKLMSACKDCSNKKQREFREKNKEAVRENDKKQYQKHKEKRIEYAREYRRKYPEKTKETNLKSKYGISLKEYTLKLKQQNNKCFICGKNQKEHSRALSVDHNHKTGKVRGLLCDGCNYGVGFLEKHKKKYEEYLEKFD